MLNAMDRTVSLLQDPSMNMVDKGLAVVILDFDK